jgi:hypothetical protein
MNDYNIKQIDEIAPGIKRVTHRGKRYYTCTYPDIGEVRHESVTTIISRGVPKPWLAPWGYKAIATAITDMATDDPEYLIKRLTEDREDSINWVKKLPYRPKTKAAKLGTLVHRAAEHYMLGKPQVLLPPEAEPYMASFRQFIEDRKPELVVSEAPLFNKTRLYAGTLDAILKIEGEDILVDYKTGVVAAEVGLQLSAYRFAEYAYLKAPDGTLHDMPEVERSFVLRLQPDGYEWLPVETSQRVYDAFLFAREVGRFQLDIGPQVVADPVPAGTPMGMVDKI